MAETLEMIATSLRTAHPFPQHRVINGDVVEMTQSDYDAWIAETALDVRKQQIAQDAEAAENTRRDQAKALYTALKAGTATNAQTQKAIAYLLRQAFSDLAP